MLHISLSGEVIGNIFGLPVTNSIFTTWIVMAIMTILAVIISKNIATIPSHLQSMVEIVVSSLYSLFEGILGEKTKKFFPLLATIFLFIWFNNLIGIFPGINSIGIKEKTYFTPLLRPSNADLNTTLALAIIAIVTVQYYGIRTLGVGSHVSKYLNFKNPINFFVGILEIISEFSRVLSFAFRLFGNIFAGEVLLTVIAFLLPVIAPIPFMGLELFVGFIQALVFSMLTAGFLSLAAAKHH